MKYSKKVLVMQISAIMFIICIVCILDIHLSEERYALFDKMIKQVGGDGVIMDVFLAQLANSFLVITLLTILSNKEEIVLWQDIIKMELIDSNMNFQILSECCLFMLVNSFVYVVMQRPIGVVFSFIISSICLVIMTVKIIRVYFRREALEKKLIKIFKKSCNEKQQEFLEKLSCVISNNIYKKDIDTCMHNIEFLINVFKGNSSSNIVEKTKKLLIDKLYEFTPYDSFLFTKYLLKIEKIVADNEETEVAIRRYLKILIKNNNGDFETKKYIIQVLTQRLRDKIRKCYSEDDLDVIAYAALSCNMRAERFATKLSNSIIMEIRQIYKMIDIIQYSYHAMDLDVLEKILETLNELVEVPYDFMKKHLEKTGFELSDLGVLDYLDVLAANENEKRIIKGIIKDDKERCILTEKQHKLLKHIFLQEQYEPSEEKVKLQ